MTPEQIMAEWCDAVAGIAGWPGPPPHDAVQALVRAGDAIVASLRAAQGTVQAECAAASLPVAQRETSRCRECADQMPHGICEHSGEFCNPVLEAHHRKRVAATPAPETVEHQFTISAKWMPRAQPAPETVPVTREQLRALTEKWRDEANLYPESECGEYGASATRLCANELDALTASPRETAGKDGE